MSEPEPFPAEFAQWLVLALPGASSDLVKKRWDGVTDTSTRIGDSTTDVLDCVRLALALPVGNGVEKSFRASFIQRDPSFAPASNALEIQILAGACLVSVMRADGSVAAVAALGLLAGDACGARRTDQNKVFIEIASRERKRFSTRDDNEDAWPTMSAGAAEAIRSNAAEADADRMYQVASYAVDLSAFGERGFLRLREEASISWWVLGQFSRDFDQPVHDLPAKAAPIVLGKELADLTRTEVGPVSTNAVLWRMLTLIKKNPGATTFAAAIEACPADWLGTWIGDIGDGAAIDALTPVLAGVSARQAAGGAEWNAAFLRSARLDADRDCDALALAVQIYFECLLVRARSENSR
jgi:hypothetical protein